MTGLYNRACRSLGDANKVMEIREEAANLRQVLVERATMIALTLEGGFPAVLDNLWLGEEEAQAVTTSLQPKLQKTRTSVEGILSDVATLEVALRSGSDPVTLANLMPRYWADFIRNSDISEVKPIGTISRGSTRIP